MYTIQEIAELTGCRFSGDGTVRIRNLATDSRVLAHPSDTLFFALVGVRHNGHAFLPDLYKNGVHCFVISEPVREADFPGACFLYANDTLDTLQRLAAAHRKRFSLPVIAITGSNGKTVVKEWIFQSLHRDKDMLCSPKSYNSQVGVPLSVWPLQTEHTLAVFEAGISKPGEMEKLEAILRPDYGIFTHLGEAHQENFSSMQQKAYEKSRLFTGCSHIIYCVDNPIIRELFASPEFASKRHITWSLENNEALLAILPHPDPKGGTQLQIDSECLRFTVRIPFTDAASIANASHVIALLYELGYSPAAIAERMAALHSVEMRLEQKQGILGSTLVNDSYNSDLGSLTIALDFLNLQHQHLTKTLILSDILQSGRHPDGLYSEVARLVETKNISRFIGIGPDISAQAPLFGKNARFFDSTRQFLEQLQPSDFADQAILIKGSRVFRFEQIVAALEEKVHETVLEINLDTMVNNLNHFRSLLRPETKITAMVKAFSYGSGSFEIANVLQYHRIDYLAVAFADEGKQLRDKGIGVPIMVMNPEGGSFEQLLQYKLEPEIFSFGTLLAFLAAVRMRKLRDYPIHIKLDTGMHRLGFQPDDLPRLIDLITEASPDLRTVSLFSHLAGADEPRFDPFTREQISRFDTMSQQIMAGLHRTDITRHLLNSAGIERFPEAQFDMVRLGIGLYGMSATGSPALRQISTLKSIILQIKEVETGESVGYSRNHRATEKERIGVVAVGYADGLRRSLGNGNGKVLVGNRLAPIVGNICMDMCMINLTEIEAREGDEVIFFGPEYPITHMAEQLHTIPYEILTSISPRVKRVYFRE